MLWLISRPTKYHIAQVHASVVVAFLCEILPRFIWWSSFRLTVTMVTILIGKSATRTFEPRPYLLGREIPSASGSDGIAAFGPPVWIASAFDPFLTSKRVPAHADH